MPENYRRALAWAVGIAVTIGVFNYVGGVVVDAGLSTTAYYGREINFASGRGEDLRDSGLTIIGWLVALGSIAIGWWTGRLVATGRIGR